MKLLAFVDIHGSLKALKEIKDKVKRYNPDLIICAGDLSIFENGLDYFVHQLSKIKKPILFIHGNHESEEFFSEVCNLFPNTKFIHKKAHKIDNYIFLGYGGGGFSLEDKQFEKAMKRLMKQVKDEKIILITHAPPHNTILDKLDKEFAGNKSIRRFIENNNILVAISGHLHENAGKKDKIKNTLVINPGPMGKIIEI